MIAARILADSINPAGVRLTSWLLTYPRFIHSEFMTHRVFSRNAASSRARPMSKTIEAVRNNPALPVWWGSERKGMQSGDEITGPDMDAVWGIWEYARKEMLVCADQAHDHGLHKSLCNRLIEPFDHMTCIATATDHRNFFGLRAHPMAQPEFQVLAYMMLREYRKNEPRKLQWGDWHYPDFWSGEHVQKSINPKNPKVIDQETELKIAVARCARLSYLTFDGEFSIEKDLELFERLKGPPMHASPFEHVAQAVERDHYHLSNFDTPSMDFALNEGEENRYRGLSHWMQYRKLFENENGKRANLDDIAATEPEWVTKLIEAQ